MHDLEGKKLVLFGAGKSGGCLIEQNPGLNILAVADNDQAKQGGEFHGIPVISPEQIGETRCDVVVIASVWSKGILEQLDALGLSAIPTVIPGKREMKGMRDAHPFSHPPTKDVAREMSLTLRSLAEEGGIDLYLDFGTLLGAFRERDFIPWDDDIDFSVNDEQFDAFIALVRENKGRFPQRDGIQWGVELMSTGELGATVRATCRNLPGSFTVVPFEVDISRRVCREGMAVALGSMPEFFVQNAISMAMSISNCLARTSRYHPMLWDTWISFMASGAHLGRISPLPNTPLRKWNLDSTKYPILLCRAE
ncbi:LicD family protein [Pseudomonas sp. PhalM4]